MQVAPPNITVLLSTYNGEKYLREQVESVLCQEGVDVRLLVRDDGSSDNTVQVLENLSLEYPERIDIQADHRNLGATGSFLKLAQKAAGKSTWYAFCDQDDVWMRNKLARAVSMLEGIEGGHGRIYASATTLCDESLAPVGENAFPGLRFTLGAEFARHRLPGHTMVFDEALLGALNLLSREFNASHDQLASTVACAIGSVFVFDEKSYVLHRRLSSSVTPGGNGLGKRLHHEWSLMSNARCFDRRGLASELLALFGSKMSEEDRILLEHLSGGQRAPLFKDLSSGKLSCGLRAGDLETALSIAMGAF